MKHFITNGILKKITKLFRRNIRRRTIHQWTKQFKYTTGASAYIKEVILKK